MKAFILELKERSEPLFYFGVLCFAASLSFLVLTRLTAMQVAGVNAWFKPFKFALSIALYSCTMAWLISYLPHFNKSLFAWTVIVLLGFEIVYITLQAARGQQSHFNVSSTLYATLYGLMAVAATVVSVYTAYIGVLFFRAEFTALQAYYVWGIRVGILLFVIFSLEGFVMGPRLSHTIGAMDCGEGLPLVGWSTKYGDPRIAHFIGMHALQVLPLASYYLLKDVKATIALGIFYGLLGLFTLIQALSGKPFYKF
jgi:hypothetical protein